MTDRTCATCKWWQSGMLLWDTPTGARHQPASEPPPSDVTSWREQPGVCRRTAPTQGAWPKTFHQDWCGEWAQAAPPERPDSTEADK